MLFIFFLALLLFGPKKLPEIGRQIGRFIAEFKRASNDFKNQLQSEIEKAEEKTTPSTQPGAQKSSSLVPPAIVSAISEIDSARAELLKTARMAFAPQNLAPQSASPETISAPPAEAITISMQASATSENPKPKLAPTSGDSAQQTG